MPEMRLRLVILSVQMVLVAAVATGQRACDVFALATMENFDGYGVQRMPTCWCEMHNYDVGLTPGIQQNSSFSGTSSLALYPGTLVSSHYSMVIAPPIVGSGPMVGLHLRFRMMSPSTAARLVVGFCEDTGRYTRAFVPLDTLHVGHGGEWQEVMVDLSSYAGAGRRPTFAVYRGLQPDGSEMYVDDVVVESCGTSTPRVSHVGTDCLTLHWEAYGAGTVEVRYGQRVVSPATSPLTLSGLTPATDYTVEVGCAGGAVQRLTVRTYDGERLPAAYCEDFETVDSVVPRYWHRPSANRPEVARGVLRFEPRGDSCVAVLPVVDCADPSLPGHGRGVAEMAMGLVASGDAGAQLTVGVMDYAGEPSTFVPVSVVQPDGRRQRVSMASYGGRGKYVALLATGTGVIEVDKVMLGHCLLDSVRFFNLTDSAVSLSWDTVHLGAGAAVMVEYGEAGLGLGNGTRITLGAGASAGLNYRYDPPELRIEGLRPDTEYDLVVWGTCGDLPSPCDRQHFRTMAHRVLPPYCEDFDATNALPAGWLSEGGELSTTTAYSGNHGLALTNGSWAAMPIVGLGVPDTLHLDFYALGSGSLSVELGSSPYGATTPLHTMIGDGGWQRCSVALPHAGGRCVVFRSIGQWTIDEVALRSSTVVQLRATSIGMNSAHLAWRLLHGDSVRIEYAVVASEHTDFAQGSGHRLTAVDGADLTGLYAGTTYCVHIAPKVGSPNCHTERLWFSTLGVPVALPYCVDFDDEVVGNCPQGWRRLSAHGEYPMVSSERNRTGGKSLLMAAAAGRPTTAVLPDATSCTPNRHLAFWTNATEGLAGARLLVGMLPDVASSDGFVGVDTIVFSNSDVWQPQLIHLGDRAGHIALRLETTGGEVRLFVEDLCLEACAAYDVHITSADSTSATFVWAADDSLSVVARLTGPGGRSEVFRRSPATVGGMVAGESYTLTVSAQCDCGATGAAYYSGSGTVGGTPMQVVNLRFNTQPPEFSTPLCASFEGVVTGGAPNYWLGGIMVSDRNSHEGTKSLQVSNGGMVVLPPVQEVNAMVLSFWCFGTGEALLGAEAIVVGVTDLPADATSFVGVDTLRLSVLGQWQHMIADLGRYGGAGRYVTIKAVSGSGTFFIDDVALARCAIGEATVDADGWVEWHTWHGVTHVDVEYGEVGYAVGTGQQAVVESPQTRWQLPDNGAGLEVRVTPRCVGGSSCQRLTLRRRVQLTPPWCEQFDDVTLDHLPSGWVVVRSCEGSPSTASTGIGKALVVRGQSGRRGMVALPELTLAGTVSNELTLSIMSPDAVRTRLIVGTVSNVADFNTFVPHDTIVPRASWYWQQVHISLTRYDVGQRIALACASSTADGVVWIDSVSVEQVHTPRVSVVSARSLVLEGDDTGYYIECARAGAGQGQGQVVRIDTTVFTLNGLTPGQTYWLYFRPDVARPTCAAPTVVVMPNETPLSYCQQGVLATPLTLPEFSIDSVKRLHIYFTLLDGTVEASVMDRHGDWNHFVPVSATSAGAVGRQHLSLASYGGDGRFVVLHPLGPVAHIDSLVITDCEWPTVNLMANNTVAVEGHGAVEYGLSGFPRGQGTIVAAPTTLTLDNNRDYDFYPLCNLSASTCAQPWHLHTALDRCPLPDHLEVAYGGGGLVSLSWDTSYGHFWIECVLAGNAQGTGQRFYAQQPPLTLQLQPASSYDLYWRCDELQPTDRPPQQITTLPTALQLPYCQSFDTLPADWLISGTAAAPTASGSLEVDALDGNRAWVVLPQPDVDSLRRVALTLFARGRSGGATVRLCVGTAADAANPAATFDSLTAFTLNGVDWERCFFALANYYGGQQFVVLRIDGAGAELDSVEMSTCAAWDFYMSEVATDHVEIDWRSIGTPEVSITYGPRGFAAGQGTTLRSHTPPCRIEGLSALTDYAFVVKPTCAGGCQDVPADTFYTFTPQGGTGCIDYTDLRAPYVSCTWGSYTNPMEHSGVIDHGYPSGESRHTVHFDTAERDPRTGGHLRTIPEGGHASVRLGNWISGGNATPQGESITYGFTVDASESDLLVLRYAAVLQDPEHDASLQPRFRMEILSAQGELIDSCSEADFVANASLGWAEAADGVLWKDWTTVGIDLAPYDGQTLLVRLTTRDCGEGSHFGYAYFTLHCTAKRMRSEGCSEVANNRFSVPDGFRYRWWSSRDSTVTLSDSASLWVRSDNEVTYFCRLSFIDNPQCYFTMSAFAGARYPLALFDTALTVANCEFDLRLTNRSTISGDGRTPLGTGEGVETLRWLLPDGSNSAAQSLLLHLADTTRLEIGLVAGIASDQCLDTLRQTIVVRYPHPAAALDDRSERCLNAEADTLLPRHAASWQWTDGTTGPLLIAPTSDSLYTCFTTDTNGCHDTLQHHVSVHPIFRTEHTDTLCSSALTYAWEDTLVRFAATAAEATALRHRRSQHGCDSTLALTLHLWPSYTVNLVDTICQWQRYPFFDTLLTTAGPYRHRAATIHQCDSLVVLSLRVMPRYTVSESRRACDAFRWQDGQTYRSDTAGIVHRLTTVYGCDSLIELTLKVFHSDSTEAFDTFCTGSVYTWLHHRVGSPQTAVDHPVLHLLTDTLRTSHLCDSVQKLFLTELPLPQLEVDTAWNCEAESYTLVGSTNCAYLAWWLPEGDERPIEVPRVEVKPNGETTYRVVAAYNEHGRCQVEREVVLQPYHRPVPQLEVQPSVLSSDQLDFTATDLADLPVGEREWWVDGRLYATQVEQISPSADPRSDSVRLTLIANDGHCTGIAQAIIPIRHTALFVPTAFTPNEEVNATFGIDGPDIEQFDLSVYDRQGHLVFHADNPVLRWDGTNPQSKPCPQGSYVYVVRYTLRHASDAPHTLKGTVLLLR